jgi:nucleoid-associated protein YgaU
MPIMRKDVKLGLAVGGVLLAVLIVYVLVVPGNSGNQQGAEVSLSEGSEAGGATAQGSGGATDPTASVGRDTATHSGESATPQKGGDATASSEQHGKSDATNGAKADAGAGTATAGGDKPTGESAGGGWNWDALVNGTEKVPSLGAATDVPANGNTTSGSGAAGVSSNVLLVQTSGAGASGASQAAPASHRTTGAQNATASGQSGAETAGSTAQAAGGARTHVVKAGDTYSKISAAVYGNSKYYAQIEKANPNVDPTRLKPGMTITIPAIDTAKPAGSTPAASAEKAVDPKSEYKVQPNDNLYTISMRLYGKADRVEKIYELNKATIGDDMARLKVDMVLKLPEAPTQTAAATR